MYIMNYVCIDIFLYSQLCSLTRGKKINERKRGEEEEEEKGNRTFQLKQVGYAYVCLKYTIA